MGPRAQPDSFRGDKNLLPITGIELRKLYKYSQDPVRSNTFIKICGIFFSTSLKGTASLKRHSFVCRMFSFLTCNVQNCCYLKLVGMKVCIHEIPGPLYSLINTLHLFKTTSWVFCSQIPITVSKSPGLLHH